MGEDGEKAQPDEKGEPGEGATGGGEVVKNGSSWDAEVAEQTVPSLRYCAPIYYGSFVLLQSCG